MGERDGVGSGKVHKSGFDLGMPRAISSHFNALGEIPISAL